MKPPKGLDWIDVFCIVIVLVLLVAFATYMGEHYPAVKSDIQITNPHTDKGANQ